MSLVFNPFTGTFDVTGSSGGGGGSISGTIADTQVAFGTGVDTIGGSANLTWDGTTFRNVNRAFMGPSEAGLDSYIQGWWGTPQFEWTRISTGNDFVPVNAHGTLAQLISTTVAPGVSSNYKPIIGTGSLALGDNPYGGQFSGYLAHGKSTPDGGLTTFDNAAYGQSIGVGTIPGAGDGGLLYGISCLTPDINGGTPTTLYSLYAASIDGIATNSYYTWFDSAGVYRIKADNTFDSVYQAIPALYNPQFTKYTPGATNYERIVEYWAGNVATFGTEAGGTGTQRGLNLIGATVKANGSLVIVNGGALGTPSSGTLTNCTGLTEAGLTLSDVTTANVSATAHGFAPKFPNNTTTFLRGDGTYATPSGSGIGTVTSIATTSPISGGTITSTGTLSLLVNVDHAFTAAQSITIAPAANTSADGLSLIDSGTPASSGNQQFSPRLRFTGQGWKTTATAASQAVDWIVENQPVQGTTNPTTNFVISSQVNAGGYTARLTLSSAGPLTVGSSIYWSGDTTGANAMVATTGGFYLQNIGAGFTGLKLTNDSNGGTGVQIRSDAALGWGSGQANGSADTFVYRGGAAATVQFGANVNGAAVSQTIQAANGITGTDKTGGNFTLASGKGTGAGAVSSLIFQTPTVLGSGTTAQSLSTRLTIAAGLITLADATDLVLNTTTGTKLGTATGQKLGFWNVTPVVQQVLATGAGATVDNVITLLQTLGLCKQS